MVVAVGHMHKSRERQKEREKKEGNPRWEGVGKKTRKDKTI